MAFDFPDGSCGPLLVHVFRATAFEGEVRESEEMAPRWFDVREIPFDQMWQDDRHWFPLFLAEQRFTAKFEFQDLHTMVKHEVMAVSPHDRPWEDVLEEFLLQLEPDPKT